MLAPSAFRVMDGTGVSLLVHQVEVCVGCHNTHHLGRGVVSWSCGLKNTAAPLLPERMSAEVAHTALDNMVEGHSNERQMKWALGGDSRLNGAVVAGDQYWLTLSQLKPVEEGSILTVVVAAVDSSAAARAVGSYREDKLVVVGLDAAAVQEGAAVEQQVGAADY